MQSLKIEMRLQIVYSGFDVTANQTSGQKNEPRSTSAQIPYSVHHNELQ